MSPKLVCKNGHQQAPTVWNRQWSSRENIGFEVTPCFWDTKGASRNLQKAQSHLLYGQWGLPATAPILNEAVAGQGTQEWRAWKDKWETVWRICSNYGITEKGFFDYFWFLSLPLKMVKLVAGVKILIFPNTSEHLTAELGCVLIVHLVFEVGVRIKYPCVSFLPCSLHKVFPKPPWG